jgi:hypothetical protein
LKKTRWTVPVPSSRIASKIVNPALRVRTRFDERTFPRTVAGRSGSRAPIGARRLRSS